jgi:hypothetical protein
MDTVGFAFGSTHPLEALRAGLNPARASDVILALLAKCDQGRTVHPAYRGLGLHGAHNNNQHIIARFDGIRRWPNHAGMACDQ